MESFANILKKANKTKKQSFKKSKNSRNRKKGTKNNEESSVRAEKIKPSK
jgi:hypothetical protein